MAKRLKPVGAVPTYDERVRRAATIKLAELREADRRKAPEAPPPPRTPREE